MDPRHGGLRVRAVRDLGDPAARDQLRLVSRPFVSIG
jgi:hypothetical protein